MTREYADYLDFYEKSPHAPFLRERRLTGSHPVRMLATAQPAGHFPDEATPDLVVQLITRGSTKGVFDLGANRFDDRLVPGSIALTPPGAATDHMLEGPFELLVLAVPFDVLRSTLEEASGGLGITHFGRLHSNLFCDPYVEALLRRLWDSAAEGETVGTLFADAAVQTLALALLQRSQRAPVKPELVRGGLAPFRLRRVLDCVEARLGEDLSMVDLAAAAELSPLYFARAFRQEAGVTPHRHLLERRVERAKHLQAATKLPIADIASACGFFDQSHLARWFKRQVLVTPAAYRSEGA